MTLQAVRRYFEEPVETALDGFGIKIRYENQLVPDGSADLEYAMIRINFGTTAVPALNCPIEDLRAALEIQIYLEKGYGPARGQTVATDVMQALYALNDRPKARVNGVLGRVNPIVGP